MSRPAVGRLAEQLYEALEPIAAGDEERDWPLLRLCGALTAGALEQANTYLADDEDGRPGWRNVLDPWKAPASALPYLAQFVGATLEPSLTEADARGKIARRENLQRGTVPALVAAVQRTLTGTKAVAVTERHLGDAYKLWVRTRDDETPDEAATLAAILTQKPAGITLTFATIAGWSWADVVAAEATWTDVTSDYPDWAELIAEVP